MRRAKLTEKIHERGTAIHQLLLAANLLARHDRNACWRHARLIPLYYRVTGLSAGIVFIESICTDDAVIETQMRWKAMHSADFACAFCHLPFLLSVSSSSLFCSVSTIHQVHARRGLPEHEAMEDLAERISHCASSGGRTLDALCHIVAKVPRLIPRSSRREEVPDRPRGRGAVHQAL